MEEELVLVIDFGGQYCHLIGRRIRDLGVYSEILSYDVTLEALKPFSQWLKGVVLSGGPSSVYEENAPNLSATLLDYLKNNNIPILGLCYGHQLLAQYVGGDVISKNLKEYGITECNIDINSILFQGLAKKETVWMSHGDQVQNLPQGFSTIASTETCPIAGFSSEKEKIYGLQFHPEVQHTKSGNNILSNFLFKICKCSGSWVMDNWIDETLKSIKEKIGKDHVILGLSGGVDSSVVATLLQKAIGDQVHPIFVNNGVLRKNEPEQVVSLFQDKLEFKNFHYIDASERFLKKLKGIIDPEEKRKIIAHTFIQIFEEKAADLKDKYNDIKWLGQGTIFPDRVETQATSKSSAKIKSHHNVALPSDMQLKLIEPLRDLYKDEVRQIGLKMGLPEYIVNRQPFPGPGLAVRCVGEIKEEYLKMLREADYIVRDEIEKTGVHKNLWQYFAIFLPIQNVGVMGDFRTYEYICAIRAVQSKDAMTANFAKLDWTLLERISTRIINEVKGFNRVVYDISNKPPSTIEFE
ncbi:MAG: glutamine-hydrolyzing GMP synthase [Candidatus Lokiarchaeota archaeon]|nr:glutamine-hydrolyzing GMP synthase [Candidatus Lokiarchaeota archaeon]